jgi:hypothetical protein
LIAVEGTAIKKISLLRKKISAVGVGGFKKSAPQRFFKNNSFFSAVSACSSEAGEKKMSVQL